MQTILFLMVTVVAQPEIAPSETVWDARKTISDVANPVDSWTCGWLPAEGGNLTPYGDWGTTANAMSCWWDARGVFAAGMVSCPWLDEHSPLAGRPWLVLHPGAEGQRATVRWTAAMNGFVKIEAAFAGVSRCRRR